MDELSKADESFCEGTGLAGIVLSVACILQHFVMFNDNLLSMLLIVPQLLSLCCFILLLKKRYWATVLLTINAFIHLLYFLFLKLLWMFYLVFIFSLPVYLNATYCIVLVIIIFTKKLPQKLKQYSLKQKEEDDYWLDKI